MFVVLILLRSLIILRDARYNLNPSSIVEIPVIILLKDLATVHCYLGLACTSAWVSYTTLDTTAASFASKSP